jgi:hypothetical protein
LGKDDLGKKQLVRLDLIQAETLAMTYQLDRRTRRDDDRHHVTPDEFFAQEFPRLTAKYGHSVAAGMQALNAPPLTVEIEAAAWTVLQRDDTVKAQPGYAAGALIVTLTAEQFSDWVQNQMTFNGFMVARDLRYRDGAVTDISIWDSLWICLLEGWVVVDDKLEFLDRHGAPLDLTASFTPDDNPADIAHFLREAGYLHLKGWLDPEDMARIVADMDRALPHYHEGDRKSWWATVKDGTRHCVRMQEFVEHSPTTARILAGDTWLRLRKIIGDQDATADVVAEGRVIEALYKPIGVVSGPSDVPFHRDCHLGRHAYTCSGMTIGIALTPTGKDNGCLQVVAGSHRVAMPVEIAQTRPYLPVVALPTETGDLTVHLSCTLHEATPPVFAERRVMYTGIRLAPPAGAVAPADTSIGQLRERVNDILRHEHEADAAADNVGE